MTYYLVMDAWNVVVARFDSQAEAARCARAKRGFVVPCSKGAR
jgi:hypothetical protein